MKEWALSFRPDLYQILLWCSQNKLKNEPWALGDIIGKCYYDLVKNQLKEEPWALGEVYIRF